MATIDRDTAWLIMQAQDILSELKSQQYLLECLDRTIESAYTDADPCGREELTKMTTVLDAYDNGKAVTLISQAIQLLEEAKKR
jgi:hypothetical protein